MDAEARERGSRRDVRWRMANGNSRSNVDDGSTDRQTLGGDVGALCLSALRQGERLRAGYCWPTKPAPESVQRVVVRIDVSLSACERLLPLVGRIQLVSPLPCRPFQHRSGSKKRRLSAGDKVAMLAPDSSSLATHFNFKPGDVPQPQSESGRVYLVPPVLSIYLSATDVVALRGSAALRRVRTLRQSHERLRSLPRPEFFIC